MAILKKIGNLRLTFQLSAMLAVGLALFLVGLAAGWIHTALVEFFGIAPESGLAQFTADKLGGARWIGVVTLVSGVSIFFAASGVESWYQNNIEPIFQSHTDRLSSQLRQSSIATSELLGAKTLSNVVQASSPEAVRSQLTAIHAQAYGEHCFDEASLYAAVSKKIGRFYDPLVTHRSDYNQTVTIRDLDEGRVAWHEETNYFIHAMCLEANQQGAEDAPKKVNHLLTAWSESRIDDLSFTGDDPKFSFSISVDGEVVFDTKTDLKLEGEKIICKKELDGLSITRNGETFIISLKQNIELTKPRTSVEVRESSVILDDYFINNRKTPTFGSSVNIHLPDGWSFETILFGSRDDWLIQRPHANTLSAITNEWVLPGVTFFARWQK